MTRRLIIILLLLLPSIASATTWYVRPDTDGNGTDLNYGAEDGTTEATAFDGFADIAGIAAGDTVCLPGSDEPFFERLDTGTAGTATAYITYKGCGTDAAVIWSAQGISGNRSFDSSRAEVSGATYAWSSDLGGNIYRKQIDVRPRMLWEGTTWLQPVDINALSEATILSTLAVGQWGVRDNGDSTYRIYYRATASANTPATTVIRCDNVPLSDGNPVAIVRVDQPYQYIEDMEIWGTTATTQARSIQVINTSHVEVSRVRFYRNEIGPAVTGDSTAVADVVFRDCEVLYSSATGAYIQGGAQGVTDLLIDGGEFSYSLASSYNGSGFTSGDGDGIGVGQGGGEITGLTIRGVTCRGNDNVCVFIGTTFDMTVTNVSILGMRAYDNANGCYGERADLSQAVGLVVIAGFECSGVTLGDSGSAMALGSAPATARTVIVQNGTFHDNASLSQIHFIPHANNNFRFYNLVFTNNTGGATTNNGDFMTGNNALIGDEVFSHLFFYSSPNAAQRFARLGSPQVSYLYSVGADKTAFESATGATNVTINTDPLLMSSTDARLQPSSPAYTTGKVTGYCRDARDRVCPSDRAAIGAYQSTSGDPAATRAVRN